MSFKRKAAPAEAGAAHVNRGDTKGSFSNGELPQFLRDLIASPPQSGDGLHGWLYKVARHLHFHRTPEDMHALLAAVVEGCGRTVPAREIAAAISNSKADAWKPGTKQPTHKTAPKWPQMDAQRRAAVIAASGYDLADLWHASPVPCTLDSTNAEFFADELFPGNPLLCVGKSNSDFTTAPREEYRGKLHLMELIVPSPMTAMTGKRKSDGKESAHTLANTGPRRYLVTEFDQGTPDEQAAIIWHLKNYAPLVLVLSSGGKSLHGWFNCQEATEEQQHRFFKYAVSLGADPATWTRSQFVRLPQGYRASKQAIQEVYYYNPENNNHDE